MIFACLRRLKQEFALCIALLFFTIIGCDKGTSSEVKLDSALETHYSLITDGKTGSARVRLRQYMDENGESSHPLFLMGLSYHQEKRYTKAVEWFTKSAANDRDLDRYPPTWHFLGWSYYYLGNATAAKGAFEYFLTLHPGEGDSIFALGLLAMDAGHSIEAENLYRKSISAQQDNPKGRAKAMARLGDVLVLRTKNSDAREMYLQAVELDPDLYEAWYHLAMTYKSSSDSSLVQEALEKSNQARLRVMQSRYATRFPE